MMNKTTLYADGPCSAEIYQGLVLEGEPLVRPLVDNLTVMLHSISMTEAFQWLEIEDQIDSFVADSILRDVYRGMQDVVTIICNGIRFEISKNALSYVIAFEEELTVGQLLDKKLSKIKVEFTGTGLRFMRENPEWSALKLITKPFLHDQDHFTRIDFAFDLLNYRSDFLKQCISWCDNTENHTATGRLRMMSGQPMCYDVRGGAVKTLYLGSPTSDRRLRVYDKKHEQGNLLHKSDFPDCDSWVRVEWQLRNTKANGYHFQQITDVKEFYLAVFKQLFDTYKFAEPKGRALVPCDFWLNLWNWEEIETIIQNAGFVNPVDVAAGIRKAYEAAIKKIAEALPVMHCNPEDVLRDLNDYIRSVNHPKDYEQLKIQARYKRRYLAFSSALHDFEHTHFDGNYFSLYPINHDPDEQPTDETKQHETKPLLYIGE